MMRLRRGLGAVAVVLACAVGSARADDVGKDVVVTTTDGMKLAATWWDVAEPKAPGVVLLHMYASDRAAWAPLIPHLRRRGIEVLAVDLRGHGGSVKQAKGGNLAAKVEKRDAALFAQMHQDAIAAVRWLAKDGKCDPKRIALVGASVGASIAIDAARRNPGATSAVVCLSPGAAYLGLDSLAHAKEWPAGEPLLVAVHKGELEQGAAALREALPASRQVVYEDAAPASASAEGAQWAHGTRMFGRIPLVEQTVASFVALHTGSKRDDVVLDGVVDDEAAEGGAWTRATQVVKSKDLEAWAVLIGRRVMFGGRLKGRGPALFVGLGSHFPEGTAPGRSSDPDPYFPETAAIDVAKGAFAWSHLMSDGAPRGMKFAEDRGRPCVRVVPTADGFTFEGEWVTEYGDGPKGPVDPDRVKLAIEVRDALPDGPQKGPGFTIIETAWESKAAVVPQR